MNICRSIKFCFHLGFTGIIAHAMLASVILLISFAIDAITEPFLRGIIVHQLFPSLCVLLAVSWVVSPLALRSFKKAMSIANETNDSCAAQKK